MTDRLISLNAAIEDLERRKYPDSIGHDAETLAFNDGLDKAIEALRALPDASDMQMMNDLVNYGVHVTRGGERVDPMDFYAEPPK